MEKGLRSVAFVMTEVEDSVARWEHDATNMAGAMSRLDAIAADAATAHRGAVVKPRGEADSHFLVFDDASDATAAALTLARAAAMERWPGEPVRLRIAVHAGPAVSHEDDWYGPTINRCARIRSATHPGQVLVSQAAARLTEGRLPDGATLVSLGLHRLKDLPELRELYQLAHDDLPGDFPPPASLPPPAHGLPIPPTTLLGRDGAIQEVDAALDTARLVTLVGLPGVGKSRLAFEVAAARHERGDVVLVIDDVLERIGSLPEGTERVIATSRSPLGLPGEVVIAVEPLSMTDAVVLFRDRASAARPDFELDNATLPAIEAICAQLDGLPLAIELAAARVAVLTPAAIAARLDDPLKLLVWQGRRSPARHRSMREAIEWGMDDRTREALGRVAATTEASGDDLRLLREASLLLSDGRLPWVVRRYARA